MLDPVVAIVLALVMGPVEVELPVDTVKLFVLFVVLTLDVLILPGTVVPDSAVV